MRPEPTERRPSQYQASGATSSCPIALAPVGDAAAGGSTVAEPSATTLTMTDTDGTVTTWTKNSGGAWTASSVADSAKAGTTAYVRDASGRVLQIIAAVPADANGNPVVNCVAAPLTTTGCRTLSLNYTNVSVAGVNVSRLTGLPGVFA